MIGAGVAGWSMCGALMMLLRERGLLTRSDGAFVIEMALLGLERLSEIGQHDAVRAARALLEREMEHWHAMAGPEDGMR
jgi:hypothetical protein